MARKRSDSLITEDDPDDSAASETLDTLQAPESDVEEEEDSVASPSRPMNKREAVREAMEAGHTMPKAIAGWLKDTYNIAITPAHVSTIKGNMKKGYSPPKPRGRKKTRLDKPAGQESSSFLEPRRSLSTGSGLSPQDLAELAGIAERAGGVSNLQEFLDALQRIR